MLYCKIKQHMQLYRTTVAVISMFYYLVCAPVCSCASNEPVIQLLVCVLRRVLMNVPVCGIINLKGPTALRSLNSQDVQDPLTKSLAMLARHSCSRGVLRCSSCGELQLEFIPKWWTKNVEYFCSRLVYLHTVKRNGDIWVLTFRTVSRCTQNYGMNDKQHEKCTRKNI